jgi:cell wall-associated NlpC family hydrolase
VNDGRKRIVRALATVSITAIASSMFVTAPAPAAPAPAELPARPPLTPHAKPQVKHNIDSVQAQVDRYFHQAEQASERYNDAKLETSKATKRLHRVQRNLDRQQKQVALLRRQVASSIVAQYQGQGLDSTSQVLLANNPDAFIDKLTTVSAFNDQRSQMLAEFAVQEKRLETRRAEAKRELTHIAATKKRLGVDKAEIDHKAAEAKALLGRLKQRAADRQASRSDDRTAAPTGAAPASGRAAAAVRYAMAQVGDAYVYGAAGPSAFDCSGLTMAAWQQAGVSLPHSSSAQMGSGTPVSQSQLQPGDLVFYYSPVSHVGMYIGNGQIVNAENPSVGVKITGVNSMPYAGAVRPG